MPRMRWPPRPDAGAHGRLHRLQVPPGLLLRPPAGGAGARRSGAQRWCVLEDPALNARGWLP